MVAKWARVRAQALVLFLILAAPAFALEDGPPKDRVHSGDSAYLGVEIVNDSQNGTAVGGLGGFQSYKLRLKPDLGSEILIYDHFVQGNVEFGGNSSGTVTGTTATARFGAGWAPWFPRDGCTGYLRGELGTDIRLHSDPIQPNRGVVSPAGDAGVLCVRDKMTLRVGPSVGLEIGNPGIGQAALGLGAGWKASLAVADLFYAEGRGGYVSYTAGSDAAATELYNSFSVNTRLGESWALGASVSHRDVKLSHLDSRTLEPLSTDERTDTTVLFTVGAAF